MHTHTCVASDIKTAELCYMTHSAILNWEEQTAAQEQLCRTSFFPLPSAKRYSPEIFYKDLVMNPKIFLHFSLIKQGRYQPIGN